MNKSIPLSILLIVMVAVASDPINLESIDSLEVRVKQEGPKRVMLDIFSKQEWDHLLNGIGQGNIKCLKIGKAMRAESDGGGSEELIMGFAEALGKKPALVFRYGLEQTDTAQIEWVCGNSEVEGERALVIRKLEHRLAAVTKAEIGKIPKKVCADAIKKELKRVKDSPEN